MILVLFFFIIIFFFSLTTFLIRASTLKINIKKLRIYNWDNDITRENLEKEILAYFELYLLGKFKILSLKIDNQKINKLKEQEKFQNINFDKIKTNISLNKENIELLKKIKINLEKFYLNLYLGSIDTNITTWINFIIIIAVSIFLEKTIKIYDNDKYKYQILPIFNNKNSLNLQFACILNIKMVHIINIMYSLIKRRRVYKNERTSNRRSYAYSHE